VLSLIFDAVGVAAFTVYYVVLFCRPGTQNNLLFLNAKPNSKTAVSQASSLDERMGMSVRLLPWMKGWESLLYPIRSI